MKNLTPHAIRIVRSDGSLITEIPASGQIVRVAIISIPCRDVDGIPISAQSYGAVTGLPEYNPATRYIVSAIVRLALPDRTDLYSPGELVRDEKGQPIGCIGLICN